MAKDKIRIFLNDDDNRVEFHITHEYCDEEEAYRTNKYGTGLWEWQKTTAWDPQYNEPVYEWKQILGTSQFELTQQTRSGMRRYIERYFELNGYRKFWT